jgi:hypothetical protein
VFHSVFWNIIQVTSRDDMMIDRITAAGPFEGGTTKAVTRRGVVRPRPSAVFCVHRAWLQPGYSWSGVYPPPAGTAVPGTSASRNSCWRSTVSSRSVRATLPRRRSPDRTALLQSGVPGHAQPGQLRPPRAAALRSGAGSRRAARLRVPLAAHGNQPRPGRMA